MGVKRRLPAGAAALSAAAAEGALGFGARFVDIQGAAVDIAAVQLGDGAVGIRIGAHLDESETLGPPGIAIGYDADALHGAVRLKHAANGLLGSVEAEISYKNIFHLVPLTILD